MNIFYRKGFLSSDEYQTSKTNHKWTISSKNLINLGIFDLVFIQF